MVQMRIMGDDEDRTREIAALVIDILSQSGRVLVGDPADLRMRGPGARIVVEVSLPRGHRPRQDGPLKATAERVRPNRPTRTALPPATPSIERPT